MPLELVPRISDDNIEEYKEHVKGIRARRMLAAMEHFRGQAEKLDIQADKLQRQLRGHYDMLEKAIASLDRAHQRVEDRLDKIEQLRGELGLNRDVAALLAPAPDEEDEDEFGD